jgi:adhesin transport system outer membrane protein
LKKILLFTTLLTTFVGAETLQTTVEEVLSTNPTVLERLKNYNAVKEDITSAEAGYYPKLDLSIGVGYEDTKKDDRPGLPDEDFDYDVYQNSLTYTQNIFKGFETKYRVLEQKHITTSAAYSYIEKVNSTAFDMVSAYLEVMKNNELLQTAKENVDINKEIFVKVNKLYESGLTTLSEVNKIESSLALAKSNYVVQENTILDVSYNLQKVLGRFLDPKNMTKPEFNSTLPKSLEEATQFAIKNNPSLLVSDYNIKLAQATYQEKKSPYYPSIDIEISQSNSKDVSAIEGKDDKFKAMLYIRYNLFNGFADSAALQKSISKVHQEIQTKNNLRRQVIQGLNLSWASNDKLTEQLKHLEDYKSYSLKTLTLYAKEYDLGRRSLLDLLSAQNDFIGAKAQIINTKYRILFAKYRIVDAMGTLVPTVMGDNDLAYSNVGLLGKAPQNNDILPVKLDSDNDLITDEKDLCANSLESQMKNIYGCKETLKDTKQIERYSGFLFEDKSLTTEGKDRFGLLIKQIQDYGFENMRFVLLSNLDDEDINKEESLKITQQRAETIKDMLIKAGADDTSISIISQAQEAPLYTNENSDGTQLNNRVDILVYKLIK